MGEKARRTHRRRHDPVQDELRGGRGRAPGAGQELQRVPRRLRRPERELPAAAARPPGLGGARVGHGRDWGGGCLLGARAFGRAFAVRAVVSRVGRGARAGKGGGERRAERTAEAEVAFGKWAWEVL